MAEQPSLKRPAPERASIIEPKQAPVRGMASSPHPLGTPPGFFPLLQNLRLSDGPFVSARRGVANIDQTAGSGLLTVGNLGASPVPGAFRGATLWKGNVYAAYGASGKIDIYKSADLSSWTKITKSTLAPQGVDGTGSKLTAGGDNRLNDYSPVQKVAFVPAWSTGIRRPDDASAYKLEQGVDLLLASNGKSPQDEQFVSGSVFDDPDTNPVRVIRSDNPVAGKADRSVALHRFVQEPQALESRASRVGFPGKLNVYDVASNTYNQDSAAEGCWAIGASPDGTFRFSVAVGAVQTDTGDGGSVAFASSMQLIEADTQPQLVLIFQCPEDPLIWNNVKLVAAKAAGADAFTVYDPTDSDYERYEVPFDGSAELFPSIGSGASAQGMAELIASERQTPKTREDGGLIMVAFPINTNGLTYPYSIQVIDFEWVGDDTTTERNMEVFAVCLSGFEPGLTQYAVSLFNHDAQCESSPVVLPIGPGMLISELGGPGYETTPIPNSPVVYYQADIPYMTPSTLERNKGVDHAVFYRREFGATEFVGMYGTSGYDQFATCPNTGVWAWTSPATAAKQLIYKTVGASFYCTPLLNRPMHDEFTVPLEPFRSGTAASGRFFAGGRDVVQVSDLNFPFRHRPAVRWLDGSPDLTSGSERRVVGEEVRAVRAVSSSGYGSAHVRVLTDKGMFSLDSGDPRSPMAYIGQVGVAGARAITTYKDSLWLLDDQRQIRALGAGALSEPSRGLVDDWLQEAISTWAGTRGLAAGRADDVAMAWWRERLYVAFTPTGDSYNTTVLVYDAEEQAWTLDVLPANFSAEEWIVMADGNGRERLYAIGNDGRIFEYEAEGQTDDFGTDITIAIHTAELHDDLWNPVQIFRLGAVADVAVGSHLAVTAIFRAGSSAAAGTIRLDDVSSDIWRWSDVFGGRGVGLRLEITGDVPAGWRLYGLVADMHAGGAGPDV